MRNLFKALNYARLKTANVIDLVKWILALIFKRSHINHKGNVKYSYMSEDEAYTAATYLTKSKRSKYEPYICLYCGNFHVGRAMKQKEEV